MMKKEFRKQLIQILWNNKFKIPFYPARFDYAQGDCHPRAKIIREKLFFSCFSQLTFVSLLICLLTVSCERQTSWEIQTSSGFLVVDCILTNELKKQEVKVYQSSAELNQYPTGVSGVSINLNDGRNSVLFTEDTNQAGSYFSEIPFRASAGNNYMLTIRYGDILDTAYAQMESITPLDAFIIDAYDSLYRFNYQSSENPSMTEVYYDWSAEPHYCQKYGACNASETFYTLDNIDVSKLFAPDKEIIEFPRNTQIIRKKYSLSAEHQDFLRSLLLETEWRGSIFDVEQANIPTNFHHGIMGWFAACMVLSDTTIFN
jgi:hypothetical protein